MHVGTEGGDFSFPVFRFYSFFLHTFMEKDLLKTQYSSEEEDFTQEEGESVGVKRRVSDVSEEKNSYS